MTVFVCLDDHNGMLFNGRRQSRDRAVIEDMLAFAGEGKIRMNAYSAKLFGEAEDRIVVEDDFPGKFGLEKAVGYISGTDSERKKAENSSTTDPETAKAENVSETAGEERFYFLETVSPRVYADKIKTLVIYYWNRSYPADLYFDIDPTENWILTDSREFSGNSHEKVTRKVYVSKGSRI